MRVVHQKLPKIIVFFMMLTFLTTTMSVGSARALSLQETTNQLTQPLKTLLSPVTQLTIPRTPQPAPQSTSSSSNSPTATAPAPSQTSTPQTVSPATSPAPVSTPALSQAEPLDEAATLERMRPIRKKTSSTQINDATLANAMIRNPATHSEKGDFSLLKATESGWQLFGLQWYWWALIGAASWMGIYWLRSRAQA